MVGWHHRLNGHEFELAPGDSEGQGSQACCSPWGLLRVGHDLVTEQEVPGDTDAVGPGTKLHLLSVSYSSNTHNSMGFMC